MNLSYLIQEALTNEGYQVAAVDSPVLALAMHRRQRMDLIILDRMFPDQDGLDAVRDLRLAGDPVPVLMLTSRSDVADRIAGLGEGADDYMGKPFSILELQARVMALLRRARNAAPVAPEVTRIGPFVLQWAQLRVWNGTAGPWI